MRPEHRNGGGRKPRGYGSDQSSRADAHSVSRTPIRRAWQGLAITFIGLGGIGAALPLIPTTPFLLLAAWAASRGSPQLHEWLYRHPRYGPVLRDWRDHRALRPRVKYLALLLMAASWAIMMATIGSDAIRLPASVVMLPVLGYLATRPTRPLQR